MAEKTLSIEEALKELERVAPGSPLLALGQTVFWDEPMKAGVAQSLRRLGLHRRFVAGVHDTDYFAKHPAGLREPGKFVVLPHNDTTTKGLWSAAGEFSALFGSETVVTKETLAQAGLRVELLQRARPDILDEATEAWGWRGVASLEENPPITSEVPLRQVWPAIESTLEWAVGLTLDCLVGKAREEGELKADELRTMLCDARDDAGVSLAGCYRQMLPAIYSFCAGAPVEVETTATTELLKFNSQTCSLPRFEIAALFFGPETKPLACDAYNQAVEGSGLYTLDKFGTGAIPFDLVVPGKGRGTIRLGTRGAVIETPDPLFLSFRKPLSSIAEFADAVERKFGPNCTLVGKAVTLIGMLAREFVFVFHEGASSYVRLSREMHGSLGKHSPKLNPILRVRYEAWDAMRASEEWLRLPESLEKPFGAQDVCTPSFALRWRNVAREQAELLEKLGALKSPIELIRYLHKILGGSWNTLASEYEQIHESLSTLQSDLVGIRKARKQLYKKRAEQKLRRVHAETQKGEHFRERIFEKQPTPEDLAERERLSVEVDDAIHQLSELRREIKDSRKKQDALVSSVEVLRMHERRRTLELEAEFRRLQLIREAVIASKGLERASLRPSAWWFPLLSPEGKWFAETVASARCYLEPLLP